MKMRRKTRTRKITKTATYSNDKDDIDTAATLKFNGHNNNTIINGSVCV